MPRCGSTKSLNKCLSPTDEKPRAESLQLPWSRHLDVGKVAHNICRYEHQEQDKQKRRCRRTHGSEGEDAALAERGLRGGSAHTARSHNEPAYLGLRPYRQLRGAVAPPKSARENPLQARALRHVRRLALPPRGAALTEPARPRRRGRVPRRRPRGGPRDP